MTVSSSTSIAGPYNGDGSNDEFPFAFKVFATSDVLVVYTDIDGVEYDDWVLGVDYTVALNGDQDANPGGTVTATIAPVTGTKITLLSQIPMTQGTALQNQGGYYPKVIERAFDKCVRLIQQVNEKVGRALVQPVSAAIANLQFPTPTAGKVLGWDETGAALRNYDAGELASVAAFANWSYENFSGDGTTDYVDLAGSPGSLANMDVSVGGVVQRPGIDYTLSGVRVTFTTAPTSGTNNISIRYGQSVPSTDLPAPGTNRNALMSDGANWASRAIVLADLSDATAAGRAMIATASLQAQLTLLAGGMSHVFARNATQQTLSSGGTFSHTIVWDSEVTDKLGEYDPSTGQFTATNAGVYIVSGNFGSRSQTWTDGDSCEIAIYVNSTARGYFQKEFHATGAARVELPFHAILSLSASDVVTVRLSHSRTGGDLETEYATDPIMRSRMHLDIARIQ